MRTWNLDRILREIAATAATRVWRKYGERFTVNSALVHQPLLAVQQRAHMAQYSTTRWCKFRQLSV